MTPPNLDAIASQLRGIADSNSDLTVTERETCAHAAQILDGPDKPFAWYRILNTGVVLVPGENPPAGEIWSPLYRAPIRGRQAHPLRVYSTDQCEKHKGNRVWDMQMQAGYYLVTKECPICEKEKA